MESVLKDGLLKVCKLLEQYEVEYILVGGTAVALNGYYRHSIAASGELTNKPDIDIWYNPTYENYFNFLKVLEALGEDVSEFRGEQSPDLKRSFFRLNFEDLTFDALPVISANIRFYDANQRKEMIELEDTSIYFMNYYDLIEDKKATARQKDIEDIDQLQKRREEGQ